jgi:hypothetical protein
VLQHAALASGVSTSYCYGSGSAPVWYRTTQPQADIAPVSAGTITVTESYGDGIPWS